MGLIAKSKTKKRIEPVLILCRAEMEPSTVPTALVRAITSAIIDTVQSVDLKGVYSSPLRGRNSVIAGAILSAAKGGASSLLLTFPTSANLRWDVACGITLRDGRVATDWNIAIDVVKTEPSYQLRLRTPGYLTNDGALVNGKAYDTLKARLVEGLTVAAETRDGDAIDNSSPAVRTCALTTSWEEAMAAFVERARIAPVPDEIIAKRATISYRIETSGENDDDARPSMVATLRGTRATVKGSIELYPRWSIRMTNVRDHGEERIEFSPLRLTYGPKSFAALESLQVMTGELEPPIRVQGGARFCGSCGTERATDDAFCAGCGTHL